MTRGKVERSDIQEASGKDSQYRAEMVAGAWRRNVDGGGRLRLVVRFTGPIAARPLPW
jgi:hypothetical protein